MMVTQLPQETLEQHEGEWVAWDAETGELLGAAKSIDELIDGLDPEKKDRVIGYERVIPRDAVIVGGFGG